MNQFQNPGPVGGRPMIGSMQGPMLTEKPDYIAYCNYLESRGWRREQLTLDEINTTLVTLTALAAAGTGVVIDIRAPAGQKVSIMGTQQVQRGADARTAHALRVRLADSTDTEISYNTKIRITKEKTSEAVTQLARVFYSDIANTLNAAVANAEAVKYKVDTDWYRFKQGVELNGEQRLRIYAIAPNIAIDDDYTKFALDLDLWTKEE